MYSDDVFGATNSQTMISDYINKKKSKPSDSLFNQIRFAPFFAGAKDAVFDPKWSHSYCDLQSTVFSSYNFVESLYGDPFAKGIISVDMQVYANLYVSPLSEYPYPQGRIDLQKYEE